MIQFELQAAAAGVDWPWRPKDLEALQKRFMLVGTPATSTATAAPVRATSGGGWMAGVWGWVRRMLLSVGRKAERERSPQGRVQEAGGGVLTYGGFLEFWSGVEGIMEKVSGTWSLFVCLALICWMVGKLSCLIWTYVSAGGRIVERACVQSLRPCCSTEVCQESKYAAFSAVCPQEEYDALMSAPYDVIRWIST